MKNRIAKIIIIKTGIDFAISQIEVKIEDGDKDVLHHSTLDDLHRIKRCINNIQAWKDVDIQNFFYKVTSHINCAIFWLDHNFERIDKDIIR